MTLSLEQNDCQASVGWRFQLYWIAASCGAITMGAVVTALPLVILQHHGGGSDIGTFGAVFLGTQLLLSLLGGAITDILDPLKLLVLIDGLRTLLLISCYAMERSGVFTPAACICMGALFGLVQAIGGPARVVLVKNLVVTSALSQALIQEEIRTKGASILGPFIGALLVQHAAEWAFACLAGIMVVGFLAMSVLLIYSRDEHLLPPNSIHRGRDPKETNCLVSPETRGFNAVITLLTPLETRRLLFAYSCWSSYAGSMAIIAPILLVTARTNAFHTGLALSSDALVGVFVALVFRKQIQNSNKDVSKVIFFSLLTSILLSAILLLSMTKIWWMVAMVMAIMGAPQSVAQVFLYNRVLNMQQLYCHGKVIASTLLLVSGAAAVSRFITGHLLSTCGIALSMLLSNILTVILFVFVVSFIFMYAKRKVG